MSLHSQLFLDREMVIAEQLHCSPIMNACRYIYILDRCCGSRCNEEVRQILPTGIIGSMSAQAAYWRIEGWRELAEINTPFTAGVIPRTSHQIKPT